MDVLIVEDELIIALHLEGMLEDEGHKVTGVATTPSEAEELADAQRPDIAICDFRLAGGTYGNDAAERLSRLSIPCLMVTAACDEARKAPASAVGCLTKPVEQRELSQSLDAVMDISHGRQPQVVPRRLELFVPLRPH